MAIPHGKKETKRKKCHEGNYILLKRMLVKNIRDLKRRYRWSVSNFYRFIDFFFFLIELDDGKKIWDDNNKINRVIRSFPFFFFFNNLKCEIIIINFVDLSYLSTKQDSRRKRVKGIEGFHFFPFFSIFKIYNEMINFVVRSFILEK